MTQDGPQFVYDKRIGQSVGSLPYDRRLMARSGLPTETPIAENVLSQAEKFIETLKVHPLGSDEALTRSSYSSEEEGYSAIAAAIFFISTETRAKYRRASYPRAELPFMYTISFEDVVKRFSPPMFRKAYRMSLGAFNELLSLVRDLLDRPFKGPSEYRRGTIPSDIRLAVTLRLLAGGSYCDLVLAYQIQKSTIYSIVNSTCRALNERLRLKGFPETTAELQEIANKFQTSRNPISPLSGCVGALDRICVKVKKPSKKENPAQFYSRKGFHAIPVQALCDSSYIFRFCSALCTGSTHDALACSVSGLKREIEKGVLGEIFYIVGDEAYTCTEQVITPFPKSEADCEQDNFNFYQSLLRMHIEQAFGMLAARWRIMRGGLEFSVKKSTNLICLLMKLHNYCLESDTESAQVVYELTDSEREMLKSDVQTWSENIEGGCSGIPESAG